MKRSEIVQPQFKLYEYLDHEFKTISLKVSDVLAGKGWNNLQRHLENCFTDNIIHLDSTNRLHIPVSSKENNKFVLFFTKKICIYYTICFLFFYL